MTYKYFKTFILIFLIAKIASAQVGIKYDNQETTDYTSSMKSDNYTYLVWDRNDDGDGMFTGSSIRPMFFYWDNDDSQLSYLIDTRNMNQLKASFYSINVATNKGSEGLTDITTFNGANGIFIGDAGSILDNNNTGLNVVSRTNLRFFVDESSGSAKEAFFIDKNTGNVGVGTTSPNTLLSFNAGTGGNDVGITQNKVGGSHTMELTTSDGNTQATRLLLRGNANGADVEFYAGGSGSEVLTMFIEGDNGNVGIGTSNPSEKLVVDGKILAEEVRVENVPSSDYVFDPAYKLCPIEDVEAFVKQNKHLPGIPSAAAFKEDGVGLGEMDDMLLKKVEELTLYVIEQNEKNERLQKEIQVLKNKNSEAITVLKNKNENLKRRLKEIEKILNMKR